jgi:signal transduction histidine kinase/Fe-S-cluster-containing hydrogenase component 2
MKEHMHQAVPVQLITTIRERCRVCFTCVRECPAKAISVSSGQAEVIPDRCIGCGNCVRVCSQHAKRVLRSDTEVRRLIHLGQQVAVCLAPSFPAEFFDIEPRTLVGMLRALGFDYVNEVAFGADLVADRYQKLLETDEQQQYIATTCPAIVSFVERYFPGSIGSLAPIVSPMVATARALRRIHGKSLKVVFVGPCIAKKTEASGENAPSEVDAVLSFIELRDMFAEAGLKPEAIEPDDFDPPQGGVGMLFSLSRGMLQAADIKENLLSGDVVAADGRRDFAEAIREFDSGDLNARLLEVLACSGCIMGPGMSCNHPLFRRRARVSEYAREKLRKMDLDQWRANVAKFADLDLRRKYVHPQRNQYLYSWIYSPMFADSDLRRQFSVDDQQTILPTHDELDAILFRMGKLKPEDELNCGACGYDTCREHAVAIYKGLAETEMCLPYTIEHLRRAVRDLDISNKQLASTQQQLMQSEKLASMGQLAAGIAHEVNNPLGVVLMYAHILLEDPSTDAQFKEDLQLIVSQADRCKKIVAGLLDFARQNRVALLPTNVHEIVDAALAALPPPEGITTQTAYDLADPIAEVDKDQIGQVLTNLISNSYAAMEQSGGRVTVRVTGDDAHVRFIVADTGSGISKENMRKIFEPFFTTKKMGKGTGLGLAVSYGIVKMHRGDIQVESNADPALGPTGATFTVTLPRQSPQD